MQLDTGGEEIINLTKSKRPSDPESRQLAPSRRVFSCETNAILECPGENTSKLEGGSGP